MPAPRDVMPLAETMSLSLQRLGLVGASHGPLDFEPLTGGVASDIFKVTIDKRVYVVKRALSKLRVAEDWQAPRERNAFEYFWLATAGALRPGCAPKLYGHDPVAQMFVMEYLDPIAHPVWKSELRDGRADPIFAAKVGAALADLHRRTAGNRDVATRFATDAIFQQIRLEPYLLAAASKNPQVAAQLTSLAQRTLATRHALVHGDVSPKNILCAEAGPIFLDAECAWYGDPAFDLAFCLNHLLLKCLWTRAAAPKFMACFAALAEAYLRGMAAENPVDFEGRAAPLLAALLLARIDGKSPVEYVTAEQDRYSVRQTAIELLLRTPSRLCDVARTFERRVLAATHRDCRP